MLEPNISDENGFIRLICGFTCTGIGIAKIARVPNCRVGHTLIVLGAMKIAEGIYHITIHTVNNQVINTKVIY